MGSLSLFASVFVNLILSTVWVIGVEAHHAADCQMTKRKNPKIPIITYDPRLSMTESSIDSLMIDPGSLAAMFGA